MRRSIKLVWVLLLAAAFADCRAEDKKVPAAGQDGPTVGKEETISRLSSLPYLQGYKPAPEKSGVTCYDKESAFDGLNFYLSGHAPRAYLTDMEGKVLHEWGLEYEKLPPGADPAKGMHWRRAHLFPNGDLLAIYEVRPAAGGCRW